jgi:uncharacterized protein (DUF58 family)
VDRAGDSRAGPRSDLRTRLARWLRPPRTLRPTRAGWIFFALTFAVGFAALNTGNNLLYLVLSLMLAFLVLSGVLSEAALRGVKVTRKLPSEIFAGARTLVSLEVRNTQRRVPAFAIAVEDRVREGAGVERAAGRTFVLRVAPGRSVASFYRFEATHRGVATFTGFRISTRFPFGLFLKSLAMESGEEAMVYPQVDPVAASHLLGDAAGHGDSATARSGMGAEVSGLREFADGDSARRIQWPASLRSGSLVVRDTERERDAEVEVRLRTSGVSADARFEQAVRRAASRVVALLAAGAQVGLRTDTGRLAAGTGRRQRRRLLSFLAQVQPDGRATGAGA